MHAKFDGYMKDRYPGVEFEFHNKPGQTGPDAVVLPGGVNPGFRRAELKPYTPSGWAAFAVQQARWGTTKPFAYDASGNIFPWPTR